MKDPQADPKPRSQATLGILDRALVLVEFLRAHCPWDADQTHESLRRYLLEEAHEVVDAIDGGDDSGLREELGDLLLNLAFQIVIAEEREAFDREQVVTSLEDKMHRRHPHLYGGDPVAWETLKARERGVELDASKTGILNDLLPGSDPLAHAHRVQAAVAKVGFDWPHARGAWEKVREELVEVEEELADGDPRRLEEELGDLLFSVVNFARLAGIHPTLALVRANAKFKRRFERLETLADERGIAVDDAGLEALDRLWAEVKGEER